MKKWVHRQAAHTWRFTREWEEAAPERSDCWGLPSSSLHICCLWCKRHHLPLLPHKPEQGSVLSNGLSRKTQLLSSSEDEEKEDSEDESAWKRMCTEDRRRLTLRLCGQSKDLFRSLNTLFIFYSRTLHWNVCLHVRLCTMYIQRPQKPEECIRFPGLELHSSETSSVILEETKALWKRILLTSGQPL